MMRHRPKAFAGQATVKPKAKAGEICIENDDGVTVCFPTLTTAQRAWQKQPMNASAGLLGVKNNQLKDNRRVTVKRITTLLQPAGASATVFVNVRSGPGL